MRDRSQVNGTGSVPEDAIMIEAAAWPQLRSSALYGFSGEVVRSATAESEADPAAVLATFLTAVGISLGRGPRIKIADDLHHPRLFCAIVGRSARARKGTSEGPIRRIFEAAWPFLGQPFAWKPGPMSSGEGLIFNIRDGDDDDAGVPDKRLLIVESELAAPLKAMRRDGNTLSTTLRSAWDGRDLEPLTKSVRIKATRPHVGIVGHITEAELERLLGHVEIFNGFANRFLWFCARRQRRLPLARGLDDTTVERLGRTLAAQLAAVRDIEQMTFSPGAERAYKTAYEMLTVDKGGFYDVVTSRAEVQVIRLAMIYACLDGSNTIELPHLEAALAVWDYCDASARRLFGDMASDPLKNRICAVLASGPKSTTALHRALGNHTNASDLRGALAALEGQGRIDGAYQSTNGRSGTVWRMRTELGSANEAKKAN